MSEYELRLAQARLSEDAGEADKDNEDDSCVIPILSDMLELFNWSQTIARPQAGYQRPESVNICCHDDFAASGSELRTVLPDVRYPGLPFKYY